MKIRGSLIQLVALTVAVLMALSGGMPVKSAQETTKPFSQEQLDQLLAPVALYPDSLLTQILMASTYPLEVVKAENWAKQHKDLKGDALTAALEKQDWEASVKSLINFPQVLQMMSDQIDWTQKLGDAFLAQQKDVMNTVQKLRQKAQAQGNLKTTKEQKVTVDKTTQVIIVEPSNPQVVYVPTYNPAVVYGTWWYPAPPVYLYPPPPPGYTAFTFAAGVAVGAAWGYAWGSPNWHGGDINIYPPAPPPPPPQPPPQPPPKPPGPGPGPQPGPQPGPGPKPGPQPGPQPPPPDQGKGHVTGQGGKGTWQHDPGHRQGVAYRDGTTAQKYGQQPGRQGPAGSEVRGYSGARRDDGRQAASFDRRGEGQGAKSAGVGGKERQGAFNGARNGKSETNAAERGRMSRGKANRR